jgi:RNA polymerase sigma-70 factor (ECF subfamily)
LKRDRAAGDALLARIARGDVPAVAELYDRYAALVFPTALRILRSRVEAEDVLHDAFVNVTDRAAQFDAERGSVVAWLMVLVRNLSIDRLRRTRRRAGLERLRVEREPSAPAGNPETESSDAEARVRIRRALNALPEAQRMTLESAFFEGLSYPEIAARHGLPVGTIKSRVHRGLATLREALREDVRARDGEPAS